MGIGQNILREINEDGGFNVKPFSVNDICIAAKMQQKLKNFICEQTEIINTVAITDSISEEFLKQICENYYKIKNEE